jgi:hypothetical protein
MPIYLPPPSCPFTSPNILHVKPLPARKQKAKRSHNPALPVNRTRASKKNLRPTPRKPKPVIRFITTGCRTP